MAGLAGRLRFGGNTAWVAGTFAGVPVLRRIPETAYRRTVGILLLSLGFYMLMRGLQGK